MRCSTKTVARCDHNNTTNTNSTLHPQCLHCEHHHNKTEGGNRGMQAQFFCEIECQADPNTLFASVHAGRAGAAHANPALRLSTFGLTSPDQAPTCWFSPWKSRFTSLYLWASFGLTSPYGAPTRAKRTVVRTQSLKAHRHA